MRVHRCISVVCFDLGFVTNVEEHLYQTISSTDIPTGNNFRPRYLIWTVDTISELVARISVKVKLRPVF